MTSGAQKPPSNPNLQSYANYTQPTSQATGGQPQQPSLYPNLNSAQYSLSPNNNQPIGSVSTTQTTTLSITPPVPAPTPLQREDSLNSPMQMALPDIPQHFPELDELTEVQLERLLKDSVALDAHIAAMDSVQAMESLRDMQRETNTQTATKNLQLVRSLFLLSSFVIYFLFLHISNL